jgi:hypothetical protein
MWTALMVVPPPGAVPYRVTSPRGRSHLTQRRAGVQGYGLINGERTRYRVTSPPGRSHLLIRFGPTTGFGPIRLLLMAGG